MIDLFNPIDQSAFTVNDTELKPTQLIVMQLNGTTYLVGSRCVHLVLTRHSTTLSIDPFGQQKNENGDATDGCDARADVFIISLATPPPPVLS